MFKIFNRHSIAQLVTHELQEARLALLQAHTNREYWDSIITYNDTRIARLEKMEAAAAQVSIETQPHAKLTTKVPTTSITNVFSRALSK